MTRDAALTVDSKRKGYTLIELSTVLLIIALVIGGILVGRDLIRAAEIRATIRQLDEFDAAATSFRAKYAYLPGDLPNADQFGFSVDGSVGGSGNGDGTIGWCTTTVDCFLSTSDQRATNEYIDFWYHLSAAGLIPYSLSVAGSGSWIAGVGTPPARLYRAGCSAGGWVMKSDVQFDGASGGAPPIVAHNYLLHTIAIPYTSAGVPEGGCYRPADIQDLDRKIDDGLPTSGRVRAVSRAADYLTYTLEVGSPGPDTPACVTNDLPPQYNGQYAGNDTRGLCNVAVKASF